jgi:hypothetical protein
MYIEFGGESKQVVRPFQRAAEVHCRGYSRPLQRVITDFGADVAFGKIPQKMMEHYGISIPISAGQIITESHAQHILEAQQWEKESPAIAGVEFLIAEMDGTMIPIVETTANETDSEEIDRRKTRKTSWKEARLTSARNPEQEQPIFGATIGSVDDAGAALLDCAIRAGLGEETFVHGVGDGAPWIASQIDQRFGQLSRYLLDFYHVCEYLADASQVCSPDAPKVWMDQQKQLLKSNHASALLEAIKPFQEPDSIPDKLAVVRAAYRYLFNRPNRLDYQGAIDSNLPIGSGEIESAHRYVIQSRLKLAGSWWTIENAKAMLALRVCRINQDWNAYWLNSPSVSS